jgi:hypothetical protein
VEQVTLTEIDKKEALRLAANGFADTADADLLVFNYEILPPVDLMFTSHVSSRRPRKNAYLFLTTEGGSADSAFRMMRFLQARYQRVTVVVCGWCKSAGTLMCIGAHELIIGEAGELGPLDVQIVKADEMDEQKSGLVAEAAFEKLQQEAYKFFMGFVRDIGGSEYRVTLKTASDIATKMTVGIVQPIFDKLEPVTIGEDYRSNQLARAYAERLNVHSKNLRRGNRIDGLDNLLAGYPSHGFVIDAKEASELFKNVKPLPAELVEVTQLLGMDVIMPRSRRQEQGPRLEYLNDEHQSDAKAEPADSGSSSKRRSDGRRNGTPKLPGDSKERGSEVEVPVTNGAKGVAG